jgi:hypothetical protein
MQNKIGLRGTFKVVHSDKDGNVKGEYDFPNGIVDVGVNHLFETTFNGGTPITAWYVGLINNAGFSALANADTMASHSGWTEAAGYASATRPEWTCGTAAARAITNSATVDFAIDASATIKGIFITSSSTKSGSTGTLWSTASFSSNATVVDTDSLKITYTISA